MVRENPVFLISDHLPQRASFVVCHRCLYTCRDIKEVFKNKKVIVFDDFCRYEQVKESYG